MANYKDWYFHPQEKIITYKNWFFKYRFTNGDWEQEATVFGNLNTPKPTPFKSEQICTKAFDFFMFKVKEIE